MSLSRFLLLAGFVLGLSVSAPLCARADRDASFLAPNAATTGTAHSDGAVGVEPKTEIDLGDTGINVAKRTTLFFVNQTNLPVGILSITANGDSNVDATIVSDDCTKGGKIAPSSKCAVAVEVTPKGSGQWTAEVLMTHDGAGRLARVKLTGKTSGAGEKKSTGLSLSTKDVKAIDFGKVDIGSGKAVRSALMVNDSNEPITILSIEVIAAENGLERLEQGCLEDMDLAAGESCPVTLMWNPEKQGMVSTDLIIRHSGQLGFAVIPIRGEALVPKVASDDSSAAKKGDGKGGASDKVALAPSAEDVEKMISGKIQSLSASSLGEGSEQIAKREPSLSIEGVHLIGTVGTRALLFMPDGTTVVVGLGEETLVGGEDKVKLLDVSAKQAVILLNGEKKTLTLEAVSALTAKAAKARDQKAKANTPSTIKKAKKTKDSSTSAQESP